MTLEEAKKILEKEFEVISLHKSTEPFEFDESVWIEHEKPSVLEAFRVLSKGGYYISISGHDYNMREKRLQKEYEENTKYPGSSETHIKEDSVVNPALKESASQFNDALLDEQSKKIKRLTKKISRLNKIIHKKTEELRLTKIREKNLAELGLKYVGENEKLKKNLAEKDEVIADLGNELSATKKELEEKKLMAKMVAINAKCMRAARESINDVFESYAAKYAKSTLDELKDKAYESFNAKAHKLGLVGSKDGKGIPDQMIRVDIAEELSKVLDDVIDQFLLFGEIIIKEEK